MEKLNYIRKNVSSQKMNELSLGKCQNITYYMKIYLQSETQKTDFDFEQENSNEEMIQIN